MDRRCWRINSFFFTKGDVHTPPDEATEGIDEEVDGVKGKSASRRYWDLLLPIMMLISVIINIKMIIKSIIIILRKLSYCPKFSPFFGFRFHPIPSNTKNDFWTWSAALAVLDRLTWPCSAWLNWANLRKKTFAKFKAGAVATSNPTSLVLWRTLSLLEFLRQNVSPWEDISC